jgi:hypothetical protein
MKIAMMVRQLELKGNAPHDRPGFLVGHLIGNRASFLCTKAPMLRVPRNELSASHQLMGEMFQRSNHRSRQQHGLYRVP